jgi:hypothetical protein
MAWQDPPSLAAPQRTNGSIPSIFGGEINFIDDNGPGIDGTPEDIARLFSISRAMMSSKYLRLPTRGAVGNGLRVVAGAVLASAAWSYAPSVMAAPRWSRSRRSNVRLAPRSRSASVRRCPAM